MDGTVVRITWKVHARPHPTVMFNDVLTEFEDLEQVMIAVDEDRLIGGMVLWSRRSDEPGLRIIKDEQPTAFRGGAVDRLELPRCRFAREED